MGWSGSGQSDYAAVGFDANGELYQNHPASRYNVVAQSVACENMPCSNPINHLIYTLNAKAVEQLEKIKNGIECRKIAIEDDNNLFNNNLNIMNIFNKLQPCPPLLRQAYWDYTKFRLQSQDPFCFTQQVSPVGSTAVQQCCYNYDGYVGN